MTIKEIAQMAGVSISTVSKIMNQKDASISAETRERVLRIIKEFNYAPYSHAPVGSGRSFLLGLLVRSCEPNNILKGILETARSRGYAVLMGETGTDPLAEQKALHKFRQHHVDAVLWEPLNENSLLNGSILEEANIPYLPFHSLSFEDACNIDFFKIGFTAASALIQANHRNIACLLSHDDYTEQFLAGYRQCFLDKGIPFQEQLVFHALNDDLIGCIATHAVTGILCSSFSTGLQLYERLNHLHFHVPRDITLLSLRKDTQEAFDFLPISTIMIPYFDYGRHLCQSVIHLAEDKETVPRFGADLSIEHGEYLSIPPLHNLRKLTVVGSINIDNYLKVQELPVTGKTVSTTDFSLFPGGKGINQSIGASLLGARVTLIGAVGNDMDANHIFAALDKHAIHSGCIRRCPDTATGKAYIFVQPDGNSMISILSGANASLCPEDILRSEDAFKDSGYCLFQTEIPHDVLIQAGRIAYKYGVKTILKPSACSFIEPELLKYVDILVPNQKEINILCPGKSLKEQADTFLNAGVETVIITLGEQGCYLKTRQEEEYFPAQNFLAVDNTGAGDAFICTLAVYLQKGFSLSNSIRIATYAAGFCVSREGVTPALIDQSTLESYIRKKEPDLLPV